MRKLRLDLDLGQPRLTMAVCVCWSNGSCVDQVNLALHTRWIWLCTPGGSGFAHQVDVALHTRWIWFCTPGGSGFAHQVDLVDSGFSVESWPWAGISQGLLSKGTKTAKLHLKNNYPLRYLSNCAWLCLINYFDEPCVCMYAAMLIYFSAKPKASCMLVAPSLSNPLRNLSFKWDFL